MLREHCLFGICCGNVHAAAGWMPDVVWEYNAAVYFEMSLLRYHSPTMTKTTRATAAKTLGVTRKWMDIIWRDHLCRLKNGVVNLRHHAFTQNFARSLNNNNMLILNRDALVIAFIWIISHLCEENFDTIYALKTNEHDRDVVSTGRADKAKQTVACGWISS